MAGGAASTGPAAGGGVVSTLQPTPKGKRWGIEAPERDGGGGRTPERCFTAQGKLRHAAVRANTYFGAVLGGPSLLLSPAL